MARHLGRPASGISFRTVLRQSKLSEEARAVIASAMLETVLARRAEIFADEQTPLRKFPARIGPFTHLVVLSPSTTNYTISRNVSFANPAYARSVLKAFPSFDCETIGSESVAVAEARTKGHAMLPGNTWDRRPHPVFDLAVRKKPKDEPDFLVFDPATFEREGMRAFPLAGAIEVLARNHANEIRVFRPSEPAPDLAEVRAWFGFAPTSK